MYAYTYTYGVPSRSSNNNTGNDTNKNNHAGISSFATIMQDGHINNAYKSTAQSRSIELTVPSMTHAVVHDAYHARSSVFQCEVRFMGVRPSSNGKGDLHITDIGDSQPRLEVIAQQLSNA